MKRLLKWLGGYDCAKGIAPRLKFKSYLVGYGCQYELEARQDWETLV